MAQADAALGESWVDLATTPDFDLGPLHVRPAFRQVTRDGETLFLEPRVMKVLAALSRARPEVVSRDQLIEDCWQGRVVSDDALNRCILALRKLAQGLGHDCFEIDTIPRVGYRLHELEGLVEAPDREEEAKAKGAWPNLARPRWLIAAIALVLAVSAAVAIPQWNRAVQAPVAIAVLPFHDLAPGDPYFAEGMSEEILTRLSREPAFRVSGRTTSSQYRDVVDLKEVGAKLGVDYIVEGSVRSEDHSVRVDAALVRVADGTRLWAETYDGSIDEAFAIQEKIGTQVARALSLRLTENGRAAPRPPTNGEAYNLYLTARGLIRTRDREFSPATIGLLKEAIRLDPEYAPAWAALSEATQLAATPKGSEAVIAAWPVAERQARRALAIDPDLPEAHIALGILHGFGSEVAQRHLKRAVKLDPNSAEAQLWMGIAHKAAGNFAEELAAYRRAYELDPYWFRTRRDLAIALADRGQRRAAETLVRGDDAMLARVAWSYGDVSTSVALWRKQAGSGSNKIQSIGAGGVLNARYLAGLAKRPRETKIFPPSADVGRGVAVPFLPHAPTPEDWRRRTRSAVAAQVLHSENLYAAKLMLREGRSAELRRAYDSPAGLLGLRRGERVRPDQLWDVPSVALALRAGGRAKEADAILAEADGLIGRIYRRGEVPFTFDASAAAIWAVQGRKAMALDALERAWDRGWRSPYLTGPLDLGDDPAFEALRGEPRFKALRDKFAAHWQRERREIEALPL